MVGKKLEPRTLELIDSLFAAKWFENVGQPLSQSVYAVHSWQEASEFAQDPDEVFHVVRGDYTARLWKTVPEHYRHWNDVVTLVKQAVEARTNERVDQLTAHLSSTAQKAIRDQVRWSVLHACVESEFAHVAPTGFFLPLMDWYVAGRFPCGWFGKYPSGALAVY